METIQIYKPKSKIKRAVGIVCLIIAIAPNGLAPIFYPLSFMLLEIGMEDVKNKIYDIKIKLKYRI